MENKSYIEDFSDIDLRNDTNYRSDVLAVEVKNVSFGYNKKHQVLNDVNLKIPRGKIFALLGPNGTGKTTIIRSIMGRLKVSKGSIRVFGVRAGGKEIDIPGPGAGYMPQELALFEEFTIQETLTYYGTIYHMTSDQVNQRIDELITLLNLPEKSRPVSKLSGGQQRRVSIAITMIHKPKLIILDEPTVGVDSLLRKRIWNYLELICQQNGQTVLITTHYIEEARSAANVAFMNTGTILEQANPEKILVHYNSRTLEEVFLILCQNRIKSMKSGEAVHSYEPTQDYTNDYHSDNAERTEPSKEMASIRHANNRLIASNRIRAMLSKYYILTLRRPLYFVMFYIVPIISLITMRYSIGQSPYNIPVAIYNEDHGQDLSHLFLDTIDKNYIIINEYKDNESAYDSVVRGRNYASIVFAQNFSETFETRVTDLMNMDEDEVESSLIKIYMDFSNAAIGAFVLKYLVQAFKAFCDILSKTLGHNLFRFMSAVQVQECVYGSLDLDITAHFGPSIVLVVVQVLPMVLSAFQIVTDRKSASFERIFVAGVRPIEYFIAHMIQNAFLVLTLVIVVMFFSFVVFNNTQIGSYIEVFAILNLQGLVGVSIGLMGALLLADEVSVAVGITGCMFPLWIMSGVLWPLEAIPLYFRWVTDLSPITLPLDGLRSVMLRGWTYTRPVVFYGYFISLGYSLVISLLNIIIFQKLTNNDKAFSFQFWSLN